MPHICILDNVPECIIIGILLDCQRYLSARSSRKLTRTVIEDFSHKTKKRRRFGERLSYVVNKSEIGCIVSHYEYVNSRIIRRSSDQSSSTKGMPRFYKIKDGPKRWSRTTRERSVKYGSHCEEFVDEQKRRALVDAAWTNYIMYPAKYFATAKYLSKNDAILHVSNVLREKFYPVLQSHIRARMPASIPCGMDARSSSPKTAPSIEATRRFMSGLKGIDKESFWFGALDGFGKPTLRVILCAAARRYGGNLYKVSTETTRKLPNLQDVEVFAKILERLAGSPTKIFSLEKKQTVAHALRHPSSPLRFFSQDSIRTTPRRRKRLCRGLGTTESPFSYKGSPTSNDTSRNVAVSTDGVLSDIDLDCLVGTRKNEVCNTVASSSEVAVTNLLKGLFACTPHLLQRLFREVRPRCASDTLKATYDLVLFNKLRQNLHSVVANALSRVSDNVYRNVIAPLLNCAIRSAFGIKSGLNPLPTLRTRQKLRSISIATYREYLLPSLHAIETEDELPSGAYVDLEQYLKRRLSSPAIKEVTAIEWGQQSVRNTTLSESFGSYLDSIGDIYPTIGQDGLKFVNAYFADDAATNYSDNRQMTRSAIQLQVCRNKSRWSALIPLSQTTGGDRYDDCQCIDQFYASLSKFFEPEGVKIVLEDDVAVRVRIMKLACDSKSLREKTNHSTHGWTFLSPAHSMEASAMRMVWPVGPFKGTMLHSPGISHFGESLAKIECEEDPLGRHGLVKRRKLIENVDARNAMIGPFHSIATVAKNWIFLLASTLRELDSRRRCTPLQDTLMLVLRSIRHPNRVKVTWATQKGRLVVYTQAGMCRDLATYHIPRIFRALKNCCETSCPGNMFVIKALEQHALLLQGLARTFEYEAFTQEYLLLVKQFRTRALAYNELTIAYFGVKFTRAQIYYLMHATPYHLLTLARHCCEISSTSEEALEMVHYVAKQHNSAIVPLTRFRNGWTKAHVRFLSLMLWQIENVSDKTRSPLDAYRQSGRGMNGTHDAPTKYDDYGDDAEAVGDDIGDDDAGNDNACNTDAGSTDADNDDADVACVTISARDFCTEGVIRLEASQGRCPPAAAEKVESISFESPDQVYSLKRRQATVVRTGTRSGTSRTIDFDTTITTEMRLICSKRILRFRLSSRNERSTIEIDSDAIRCVQLKPHSVQTVMVAFDVAAIRCRFEQKSEESWTQLSHSCTFIHESACSISQVSRISAVLQTQKLGPIANGCGYLRLKMTERAAQESLSPVLCRGDPENMRILASIEVMEKSSAKYPILSDNCDQTAAMKIRERYVQRIACYHDNVAWITRGYVSVPICDRLLETFSFCSCGAKVGINLFGDLVEVHLDSEMAIAVTFDETHPHGISHSLCRKVVPLGEAVHEPQKFLNRMRRLSRRGGGN